MHGGGGNTCTDNEGKDATDGHPRAGRGAYDIIQRVSSKTSRRSSEAGRVFRQEDRQCRITYILQQQRTPEVSELHVLDRVLNTLVDAGYR